MQIDLIAGLLSLRSSTGVMQPTVGGTNSGYEALHEQLMLRLEAQHSTQKEDQPSFEVPSSIRENERQSGNRACECRKLYASYTNVNRCVVFGCVSGLLIVQLSMLRQAARLAKRSVATQPSVSASIRCAAVESVCSTSGRTSEVGSSVPFSRYLGLRWHTGSAPAPGTEW